MTPDERNRTENIGVALRSPYRSPPPGFSDAPVLDAWAWHELPSGPPGRLALSGLMSEGHPRIEAGRLVVTSTIREIDASDAPRWARTAASVYRLGAPKAALPLAARAALASNWAEATSLVASATGDHTLSADAVEFCRTMHLAKGDGDEAWRGRRTAARGVAMILRTCGRVHVADAWQLLGADPRSDAHAAIVVGILGQAAALPGASGLPEIVRGWQLAAARAALIHESEQDPIATPRAIAAREPPSAPHSSSPAEARANCMEALLQRRWREAARALLAHVPESVHADLTIAGFLDADPAERRHLARRAAEALKRIAQTELAIAFEALAVDPFDREAVKKVHDVLDAAGPFPGFEWLLQGWLRLSQGVYAQTEDNADPFLMAHAAAAARPAPVAADGGEGAVSDTPAPGPARVVVPRLGGLARTTAGREAAQEFQAILGRALPLVRAPALALLQSRLADEFPHLDRELDLMLSGMRDGEPVSIAPTLLVGEPGAGKSRLGRRVAELLAVHLHRYDGSGSVDNAFAGTSRRWSTAEHSVPVEAVRVSETANPWVLVDEIDKCGISHHNGSLDRALLGFLEPENARAYFDPYLEAAVDLSAVGYILTANDARLVAKPLRDRLRLIVIPEPKIEHLPQLARTIVDEIARENGGDARWWPYLDDGELAIAETLWPGGSVRRLRKVVTQILTARHARARQ